MNFMTTVKGSLLEGFYPPAWDMAKIDECCEKGVEREDFWHEDFTPIECESLSDFDTYMGHEIAMQIKKAAEDGVKLGMILPVGPMGMYKWAVFFLKEWNVSCAHVTTFNMDEWSDAEGNTVPNDSTASFEYSMKKAFFNKLGDLTVPESQRNFATKENLPTYAEKIAELKADGGRLAVIFGIGRACHIAFWEPHFGEEYASDEEWKAATHRIAAKLHPLTIEQNAITSFKSRTTLVPCRANTVGPGLFLQADVIIGGCDGMLGRGMTWQGMSFLTTLHYGPTRHIASSYIPTLPGKLFYLKELAGPLTADAN
ncbi:MAG: glucosamine-6-phosphate isomerase [Clostridiales bacterium]|jgi:glucosamine-6-phosphate deaminase|nr:glucosamine-6-phosphate isomerase [Clostridiales bacterium]